MRARIVKIGNSQGIRIPKTLIEEARLEGEVEIRVQDDSLLISPARAPRDGWADAFRAMATNVDDELVDGDQHGASGWDEDEWEWR